MVAFVLKRPMRRKGIHEVPSEADALANEFTAQLDPVRQRKLKQLCNEQRLSPRDLVVKALDAYFAAHIK